MKVSSSNIKEKMLEFTQLFCIERNIFQRFVIVYKYVRFLNTDPVAQNILQKIFNETAKYMGDQAEDCFDEDKFLKVKGEAIFSREFWTYYTNLEIIHKKMRQLKHCEVQEKDCFDDLCRLFSKPYSKQMLELSFTVINSNVFDRLDRENFINGTKEKKDLYFSDSKSILFIKKYKVFINRQEKTTNAHKILRHIFITNKDNITDDFYYSEIAEDEFGELDYKSRKDNWRKYHTACEIINDKIKTQTKNAVPDFLVYNTGTKGKIKISKKYLIK